MKKNSVIIVDGVKCVELPQTKEERKNKDTCCGCLFTLTIESCGLVDACWVKYRHVYKSLKYVRKEKIKSLFE